MQRDTHPWEKSYPPGVSWDIEITPGTIPVLIDASIQRNGARAAIDFRGRKITYAELGRDIEGVAATFLSDRSTIEKGVALYLPNTPYHPIAFFAALKAGTHVVHLSPLDAERTLIHKLRDSGARALVTTNQKTTCTGVEMFRKLLDQGQAGDNVGVLLRGTKREEVERGQVLCKPGSIKPHTKFEAEVYVLSKEEGGRHTPFFNGYRPQFYFRTTDVTGACDLPPGIEMIMPGDNVKMTVALINPIAMEEGLRFAIREGGRTVGAGVVSKILE